MAGRDPDDLKLPVHVEKEDMAFLVVSQVEWDIGKHNKDILARRDAEQFCVAVVPGGHQGGQEGDLLPADSANLAHRRLVSLRIEMEFLGRGKLKLWQQWVQMDNLHTLIALKNDVFGRPVIEDGCERLHYLRDVSFS